MKRTIQQTNGETEGLAGLTGNVRLTFFCSEVDKIGTALTSEQQLLQVLDGG